MKFKKRFVLDFAKMFAVHISRNNRVFLNSRCCFHSIIVFQGISSKNNCGKNNLLYKKEKKITSWKEKSQDQLINGPSLTNTVVPGFLGGWTC